MTRPHSHSVLALLAWRSSYTQLMMSSILSPGRVSDVLRSIANSPSSGITGIIPSPMFSRNVANSASSCCPPVACLIFIFSVRRRTLTSLHRYELFNHLPTISMRLPCGTTVRICLQSTLKTIVMPPNGFSEPRSLRHVRYAVSNGRRSIVDTSSTTMACFSSMSAAVLSSSFTLQVDSSVRMIGHLVLL